MSRHYSDSPSDAPYDTGIGHGFPQPAINLTPLAPAPRILQEETTIDPSNPSSTQQTSRKRQRATSSRADSAFPRKRAIAACRLCRSRKVKCNNARPTCGNCQASQASCVYEDPQDFSSFDPASILILDKLNRVLTRLDQLPISVGISPSDKREQENLQYTSPSTSAQTLLPTDHSCLQAEEERQDLEYLPEQLRIPTSKTSPDAVLQWPIFGHQFSPSYMTDAAYTHDICKGPEVINSTTATRRARAAKGRALGVDEETIPDLVERFLELVHIKNPILDVEILRSDAQNIVEEGLKWDATSCLVLLACALGCVATQFSNASNYHPTETSSLETQEEDIREGNTYYNLARRRFGLLEMDIPASQCYFLAGVYEMYLLRPITAWSHFQSATKTYHLHLQYQARRESQTDEDEIKSSKCRSLEQRLYWSCYKSECELRAEINSPNSSLADVQYSDMHPSPPLLETDDLNSIPNSPTRGETNRSRNVPGTSRAHQQRQEQTWFYYLTEITLRRIINRVLNLLYCGDSNCWLESSLLSKIEAIEQFEEQLEECRNGLPPMIQFENDLVPEEELPYLIRSRVLEIKTYMYAPFLYHAVHASSSAQCHGRIQHFSRKCIEFSLLRMKDEPNRHRHHGTWYGLRNFFTMCLWVMAAVRSGNVAVAQGWRECVQEGVLKMRYWETEGPGISRIIQVLEFYMRDGSMEENM